PRERPRLIDPGRGEREVLIVCERLLDETVERRIGIELPPAVAGSAYSIRWGALPGCGELRRRALIRGARRATADDRRGEAKEPRSHRGPDLSLPDGGVPRASRAGRLRGGVWLPPRSRRSSAIP